MALADGINVKINGTGSVTSASRTTTAGSLLLAQLTASVAVGSPPTVTDSKSNTWTLVSVGIDIHSNPGSSFFYKQEGGTRGSSHTFSMNSTDATLLVVEITGNSVVIDVSATSVLDGSTPFTSNSVTPTVADFALVAGIGSVTQPFTAGGSFTKILDETNDSLYWPCAIGTRLVTGGSGSYTSSWTGPTGNTGNHIIAAKESVAATKGPILARNQAARYSPLLGF